MYHTTPCPAAAPNSASSTYFRFTGFAKLSFSGLTDVRPLSLSFVNSGDSFILRRMYSDTPSRMNESRNGMRQPYSRNASSPSHTRVAPITPMLKKNPSVAVVWMKLV